jgi:hypothetical protein
VPGSKVQPEIVQSAAGFHHLIAKALFPISDLVLYNSIALHAADDMLHSDAELGDKTVEGFIFRA